MILTPLGVPFHSAVVIGLGKNLLFKSILAHCEWAELAVVFSWQLQYGPSDFYVFLGSDYSFELISIETYMP